MLAMVRVTEKCASETFGCPARRRRVFHLGFGGSLYKPPSGRTLTPAVRSTPSLPPEPHTALVSLWPFMAAARAPNHTCGLRGCEEPAAAQTGEPLSGKVWHVGGGGGWAWACSCEPMLGLLDHHGVSRAEAYRSMTESAVAALIDRINDDVNVLPTNKLLEVRAQHPTRRH